MRPDNFVQNKISTSAFRLLAEAMEPFRTLILFLFQFYINELSIRTLNSYRANQ